MLHIEELLSILSAYDLEPYPLIMKRGVCYAYIPLTNDGLTEQAQFEVTIVYDKLIDCFITKSEIDKLLITVGDNRLTNAIVSCTQSGGGQYYDDDLKVYKLQVNYAVVARLY